MSKGWLEAFSDGVMAIVITILVLSIEVPKGDSLRDLGNVGQSLFIYLISFTIVAIYWHNHHHFFHLIKNIDGGVLWMNSLFLFSLTLFPFATSWVSQNLFSLYPSVLYGVVILLADIVFLGLMFSTKKCNAISLEYKKTLISIFFSVLALILGIVIELFLIILVNVLMLLLWVVPSKKIEKYIYSKEKN
ncbi:TMEM175 family protein [Vagococcus carniphilus]|uniref:TMEM175 family protein n=1 Tax=Vagococcus carniphilus TaxID=218144 RepID=UPI002891489F|nr:TMEM175 family protein [Vagococcus carniphilus]MDT2829888.1 TMEM175 family protein [Vagococcus carniphilus]MDT2838322.1 TMEM175 family protein [Vagococcus carniphilus]MDT2854318.1 TMEM175 family protein [Vagococcus carniphilus]